MRGEGALQEDHKNQEALSYKVKENSSVSEKHLTHKPDVLSSIPRSGGQNRVWFQRSEEKRAWTELAQSKVHLNSLWMSSAELSKYSMTGRGPSTGVPSPLILRREEENLQSKKEEFAASVCPELQLGHKKGM